MTEEYTQPLLIGNTYKRNGKFRYLTNGFFGFPLPLPKNTDRILEVEMLEHEGFTPCNLLGRSICMKIKVLREIHYNPDTYELLPE